MGEVVQVIATQPSRLSDTLSDPAHTAADPNSAGVVSLVRRFFAKVWHTL
jgi:hypothetical protein